MRFLTGIFGGELGIRTLETFRFTAFRVLHLRPLGQLSIYISLFFRSGKMQEKQARTKVKYEI